MRMLVLLLALAMPGVAFLNQRGVFGPDNGQVSDQYPTLLVAAGYAFSIWGLIFLWDLAFAAWQMRAQPRGSSALARARRWAAAGFGLTALWMPVFSMGRPDNAMFGLALAIIWLALACVAAAAIILADDRASRPAQHWLATVPLSLHAGWLSLAAFLNTAQVIVAYRLMPTDRMLPWSLALLVAAAVVLMAINQRMRGNIPYVLAAVWGLVATWSKQKGSDLPGADVAAMVALVIAASLVLQTAWLRMRRRSTSIR